MEYYYAGTKWNYYLQGAEIIVDNDHKPLARFLNGKNPNNKVNRWESEQQYLQVDIRSPKQGSCLSLQTSQTAT